MNKAFGIIHSLLALVVLVDFMFGGWIGDFLDVVVHWGIIAGALIATYFTWTWSRDGSHRAVFALSVILAMMVGGHLSGNGFDVAFDSDWVPILFVLVSGAVGNKLRKESS